MSPRFVLIASLSLFLVGVGGLPTAGAGETVSASRGSFDHSYADWDAVLRSTVSKGRVDYDAKSSRRALSRFISSLGDVSAEELVGWTRNQQLAFYVNAYNALTFQTIIEAQPVASIRDIEPNAWEAVRWKVAGRMMSLDEIEHKKLRRDLKEPRIHFVVVCAARSCPFVQRPIIPLCANYTVCERIIQCVR